MTARREARAAGSIARGGVPPQLRDRQHPMWADERAVAAFARDHGLHLGDPQHPGAAWERFDRARLAWCKTHDLLSPHGLPDFRAMRAAGIDATSSVRERIHALRG